MFKEFIKGLVKSFTFSKDYLRKINVCSKCGEPSFALYCQFCEMKMRYDEWRKKNGHV